MTGTRPYRDLQTLTLDWNRFSGLSSSSISEMMGGFLGLPIFSIRRSFSLSTSSLLLLSSAANISASLSFVSAGGGSEVSGEEGVF